MHWTTRQYPRAARRLVRREPGHDLLSTAAGPQYPAYADSPHFGAPSSFQPASKQIGPSSPRGPRSERPWQWRPRDPFDSMPSAAP